MEDGIVGPTTALLKLPLPEATLTLEAPKSINKINNPEKLHDNIENHWTIVSPTKKRPKKSLDAGIKDKSDLKTLHATNNKVFDHPEPVSKRISFGLPISKYVALTHHNPRPSSPDTHTQDSGKSSPGQQSQGEHTLPSSKSNFCFTIECDSSSGTEVPTIQTVRSVIKSFLRSQEELVIIPPTFHDLAPIWSNRELPEKNITRLMRQYIHQGRMLPASFSGKLLIGHPPQADILPSISKALESYLKVKLYQAKFGISKVINIGTLCGTFQQESQQALSHRLESLLCAHAGGHYTQIAAVWDIVYGNGNPHNSTGVVYIKCKIEDTTSVCAGLSSLYGSVAEICDTLCPMVRFVSMATLKSSELVTSQLIAR